MTVAASSASRDVSLDYLKGIGCAMMLLAHAGVGQDAALSIKSLFIFGHLAPVLFFAVTGVTAALVARRQPLSYTLPYFGLLFVFGLSYSGMFTAHLVADFKLEILQIIALGGIALALVVRFVSGGRAMLLIGLALFAIKCLLDRLAPGFDGAELVMPSARHIPWHELKGDERFVLTGFPVLPWLSFFFLGVWAYQARSGALLWGAAASGLGVLASLLTGQASELLNKWDMGWPYFSLSFFVIATAFYAARRWLLSPVQGMGVLLHWGRNSLLFLFVHLFFLALSAIVSQGNVLVQWGLAIPFTWLAMAGLGRCREMSVFQRRAGWIGLLVLIFANNFTWTPVQPLFGMLLALGNCMLGTVFAFHYKALSRLLHSKPD